jgi:hypothetical protein
MAVLVIAGALTGIAGALREALLGPPASPVGNGLVTIGAVVIGFGLVFGPITLRPSDAGGRSDWDSTSR